MKRKTLEEEIQRIKNLNGLINELYHEDVDDYLYDPEYYESKFDDPEDMEDEENPFKPDFSDELILPLNNNPIELRDKSVPKSDYKPQYYSQKETDKIFNLLSKNQLPQKDFNELPGLSALLQDKVIKPLDKNFGKDRPGLQHNWHGKGDNGVLFGFNKDDNNGKGVNVVTKDKQMFNRFMNNVEDEVKNKKMMKPSDVGHKDVFAHLYSKHR